MADNKKSSISKRSSCYLLNLKAPERTAKRLKLSFQRTSATVRMVKADREVDASVGFLDVSETGAGIFTPELLHKGALVELSITEPAPMRVRGIVAWSIPVTSGIHQGKFRCRSGIQFVFDGEAQAQALRDFVAKAGQDPIDHIKSMQTQTPAQTPNPAEAAAMAAMAGAVEAAPAPAAEAPAPADAAPAAPVAEAAPAPVVEAAPAPAATEAPAAEAVPAATEEPKAA